ncbi:MAG: protein kinase [Kofleriaceae bacterium]|nr:protein kinase [Kofleriaceae bacterium]
MAEGGDMAVDAGRFDLRDRLGAGAVGEVFRVHDRERECDVALKTVRAPSGRELYRFKREFRALADLAHPNLVQLHELYVVDDQWMFTMELVDGTPLLDRVRPGDVLDLDRLRDALYQLADGLIALHGAGKLHRDLKPANVLVEPGGRVVIVDFGLVANLDTADIEHTHERAAVGTPTYMSPEQAADAPLTPASDWYAVGAMLHVALTGRPPFTGDVGEVLAAKQAGPPPPVATLAPAAPAALATLCDRLLAPDPARRAGGDDVMAALGRSPSAATRRVIEQASRGPFVGRAAELQTLRRALDASRDRCVAIVLTGAAGAGKSALARAFLDEVRADAGMVALIGRCYEREAMPFKALDAVVDALATWLVGHGRRDLGRLTPRHVAELIRVFPVLRRVWPSLPGGAVADPATTRRRAGAALRDLLLGVALTRPLVVFIDDLQWSDADSLAVLARLIHGAPAPRLLLLGTLGPGGDTAVLATLRDGDTPVTELPVPGLADAEVRELWHALGAGAPDPDALRDVGGNPLLHAELARARAAGAAVATVDEAIAARLARVDDDARALARVVALAGWPIPLTVAGHAAAVGDLGAAVGALRVDHLVRVTGGDHPRLEPPNDRVRAVIAAQLDEPATRRAHAAIARALAAEDDADQELLVGHWLDAGDPRRAATHAAVAARAAEVRLAFHRAAELYALALVRDDLPADERAPLTIRLAHALAAAGRFDDAAHHFRAAAALVHGRDRFPLERLALEQTLRAGHLDRGLDDAQRLLGAVGCSLPATPRRAALRLLRERARLRVRGLEVDSHAAPPDEHTLGRLDALWSVCSAVQFLDPLRVAGLQSLYVREALDAGDPRHVAIALALQAIGLGAEGLKARTRARVLLGRAEELARDAGLADVAGLVEFANGMSLMLAGRFRDAHDAMVRADRALSPVAATMRLHLDLARNYRVAALWYLGRLRELGRLAEELRATAAERHDAFALVLHRGWHGNAAWLVADRPDEARRLVRLAAPAEPGGGAYTLRHYLDARSRALIDLYEGRAADAHAGLEAAWPTIDRLRLTRITHLDVEVSFLRGCAALGAGGPHHVRLAEQMARRIEKAPTALAPPLASQLLAALALHRGELDDAAELLERTIAVADDAGLEAHAASARLRLGELTGGDEGAAHVAEALAWFAAEGVVAPRRLAALLSPAWR